MESMPLPAAIDSLREEVIGLTAQLSEVSAALTRKNEDLLITNQDLLDLKETLVTQQSQHEAMTAQHADIVEKMTTADDLAVSSQKELDVANAELATANATITEQADAARAAAAAAEVMDSKLESTAKQLAKFQELYELATAESATAKKGEHTSELQLNELKVTISEGERLKAKSDLQIEDLNGQIGILEAKVARLENELGASAEGGQELVAKQSEILAATRAQALALETSLSEATAKLESTQQKLAASELELEDAKVSVSRAEKSLDTALAAQREAATADSTSSKAKLAEVQATLVTLQDDLNVLGFATAGQVKDELQSLRTQLTAADANAEETQLAHAAQLRHELAALKGAHDAEAVGLAAKVGEAKKAGAMKAMEMAEVEEELRAATAKVATLETAAAAAAAEDAEKSAALSAASASGAELSTKLTAVEAALATAQSAAESAGNELQALKKAHEVQAGKVASLESTVTLTQAQATRAQEKITALTSSQEGALGDAIAAQTSAEDKHSAQTSSLLQAREKQAAAEGQVAGLNAAVSAAEAASAEAAKRVRTLELQAAHLKTEMATKEFNYKEALAASSGGANETTAYSEKLREAVIKLAMSEARVAELMNDEREAIVEAEQRELGMAQLQASLAKQKAANSEMAATLRKALAMH